MKTNFKVALFALFFITYANSQSNIFPDDGNAGIGTITPTAMMDIYIPEEATMESGLRITTPFTFIQNSNIESLFQIRREGIITNTYSDYLILKPNGKTGIGITDPNSKLHVHNGRIQISGNNSYGGPMMIFGGDANAPNGQWGIEYVSGGVSGLNFWKPDGSQGNGFGNHFMFLADNGKVSIGLDPNAVNTDGKGTFEGDYNLYVGRGILTEKVKVALRDSEDWADYVFKDDYHLLTLSEVESYIKEKGHLPNVPSAEEIVNSGINVAEMDAKLMEKIEELTLYAIQMQKELDELRKSLSDIDEQN